MAFVRQFQRVGRLSCRSFSTGPEFKYRELFPLHDSTGATGGDHTEYRKLTGDYVEKVKLGNKEFLMVDTAGLRMLTAAAMIDIAHLLRPAHLASLSNILKDPEASENDRFVALELLKNANISSAMTLPMCQVGS